MHPKSWVTLAPCCCKQATTWKTRSTIDLTPADPMVHCEHSFQLSSMASAPCSLRLSVTPHCSINSAYSFPSMEPFFSVFINVLALLWHHKEFPVWPSVSGVKPIYSGWDTYLLFYSPRREIPTSLTWRMVLAKVQVIHLTTSISCSVNSFPSFVLSIPLAFTVIFCFVPAMKSKSCQSYSIFSPWKSCCLSDLTFTSQPWQKCSCYLKLLL